MQITHGLAGPGMLVCAPRTAAGTDGSMMDALDGINWVRIVGILVAGALAGIVTRALLRQFLRAQIEGEADLDSERRVLTLTGALRHALSLVIGFIVVLLLLSELGVDIVPLLGAAGVAEAIFCLLAIRDQVAPPTINLDNPDPECDLDYVPNVARRATVDAAIANAFGVGGQNATLALQRFDRA